MRPMAGRKGNGIGTRIGIETRLMAREEEDQVQLSETKSSDTNQTASNPSDRSYFASALSVTLKKICH